MLLGNMGLQEPAHLAQIQAPAEISKEQLGCSTQDSKWTGQHLHIAS